MGKPNPINASASQKAPPEVADADIARKPEEGSASKTELTQAVGRVVQAPPEGSAE